MENNLGSVGVRKGAWTKEEDILLRDCIHKFGEGKWHLVPLRTGLNRCRRSCRMRWLNYLKPNLKRGCFAEDEVDLILRMHKLLGNRWSLIAGRLPGRTANDVKNFWNSHICKKPPSNCVERENSTIIVKPRPRTMPKLQYLNDDENVKNKIITTLSSSASWFNQEANGDDGGNLHLNHKEMRSSPSSSPPLMQQEERDESIRWWRSMLKTSENGEGASFSILDEDHRPAMLPTVSSHNQTDLDELMRDLFVFSDVWENF